MSKIGDIIVDDLNFRKERQDIEYIKNLERQIKTYTELLEMKDNHINRLENDIIKLNDILVQIKTIIEKLYA